MQAPLDLTFRGMAPSPFVEAAVSTWMERLGHIHDRIQHCHVWIDVPHHHRRRGAEFQVKIAVAIPGADIVSHHTGDDVYRALAGAVLAARRQLQDHARICRGDVKHHAAA
jgi:ribosome-associated translation inhibitor RaiA